MTIRLNGQTSGYVELEAPATAGSNTLVLPDGNGTSGQYLQTDGSGGLSWAGVSSPAILQVVQATANTSTSSTGTSWVDTGLSGSITPTATNSKILVSFNQNLQHSRNSTNSACGFKILRDSTTIVDGNSTSLYVNNTASDQFFKWRLSHQYLDSPTYTVGDTLTYKTQMAHADTNGTVLANQTNTPLSTIILMEVAG
jgi:hypothetical protein